MTRLIPREIIFGNPARIAPRLSPDGRRLAYIAPDEGVLNVWVRTVGEADDRPVTADRRRGIRAFFWAENNRRILFIQDVDGDENWHLYVVPPEGGEARDLTPIDGVQALVLAVSPERPDEILVGLNDRDRSLHDVHRVHLETGERTLEVRNDMGATRHIADWNLVTRIAEVPREDGGYRLMHRGGPEGEWRELTSWSGEDAMPTFPVCFAADNRTLYMVSSVGANTGELRCLDCGTGEQQTIASDPEADASSVMIHPIRHTLQAVGFQKDRHVWRVLDATLEGDFRVLAGLHHGDFQVVNRDRADRTWLVAYNQDRGPVVYHAYERAAKRGTLLFSSRPELEDQPLAEMRPIRFQARDGLVINGYLTLPVGVEPRNLPAVVNVHGGPWTRDSWGYHPEAQWLANRGYACLQVNYRGSTGYGKEFVNAASREWGGAMTDDVTDATRWLIQEGIADPERIGVYGGSYGGFAVLSSLTREPGLYACGVDIVGPSNLISWILNQPPYWKPFQPLIHQRVGHPEKDEAFLKSRSPLFQIDKIEAPLLIVQGANDPRVPRLESIQIRDALQAEGKTVEYMEFEDEGHGFARPENRIAFYTAAEAFLARHLGGRCEPAPE